MNKEPKEIQKFRKEIIKEMRAKAKEFKKTGWKDEAEREVEDYYNQY